MKEKHKRQMRGYAACLMAALMLLLGMSCALAQEDALTVPKVGIAVAAPQQPAEGGTVMMYELPDENSAVLMEYYSGAILEVLGIEKEGMVRVQCGAEGASIAGYMRASDLRYGEMAMRAVPRCYMRLNLSWDTQVYGYCDDQAQVLTTLEKERTIDVHGRNADKWVQLMRHPIKRQGAWMGTDDEQGFVQLLSGTAMGRFMDEGTSWLVLPCEGEMTYEQARQRAIDVALENPAALSHIPAQEQNREALETYWSDVRLIYDAQRGDVRWDVYFQGPDGDLRTFNVYMEADGTPLAAEAGNG